MRPVRRFPTKRVVAGREQLHQIRFKYLQKVFGGLDAFVARFVPHVINDV